MIKDPESFYLPGTRGMYWFKLKRELATLDVVVVAAELGHGKRNNVLSDYTFAVRDEISGELLPIGKAYSGLTDAEIAELTEHFKQNTIVDHGRLSQGETGRCARGGFQFNPGQHTSRQWAGAAFSENQSDSTRQER